MKNFLNIKMKHKGLEILCLLVFASFTIKAQQPTVGLMLNTEDAYNGYTLFNAGPTASGGFGGNSSAYLIDNCGNIVNSWKSDYNAGLSCYLDDEGNLVRPIQNRESNQMGGPGAGGGIEIQDWEGNIIWFFDYNENNEHLQHHDICPLPNGNILVIAWERFEADELVAYGRAGTLVTEHIIEVKPTGPTSGEIVWEWHLIDHTVQHFVDSLDNYGVIADNPQLIDINLGNPNDHVHFNSVDYLEEFDLIVLSSRFLSEIYVIDHSTTTEEASSHTGGTYGKGGDILYRWGNPQNYNKGDNSNQQIRSQHGVHWVPGSYNNGKPLISIFNNNTSSTSFLMVIEPPITLDGSFLYDAEIGFENTILVLKQPVSAAPTGSSCAGLPNGNFLYSINRNGEIGEVNKNGGRVWQYIIPTNSQGPVSQGEQQNSSSFNAQKYGPGFVGFYNKDLSPKEPVELNPYPNNCIIYGTEFIDLPVADFVNTIGSNIVQFTNQSTGVVDSLVWDFGDGSFSNENNPLHTYLEENYYTTCLTVFNERGSDMACDTVSSYIFIDVNDFENAPIFLFPNPAKKVVYVDGLTKETSYKIYNNVGHIVLEGVLFDKLELSVLKNDIYYIHLLNENKMFKLLVVR